MRVAVAQFAAGTDKDANRKALTELVGQAAGAGARLVVAPECSMYLPGDPNAALGEVAEDLDGPFVSCLAALARAHSVTVLAGMFERVPGEDRAYNTLACVGPSGSLVGVYRKLHLYDAFGFTESVRVRPGAHASPLVFAVDDMTCAAMTCYDLRFPELGRVLADTGAQAMVVPAAWMAGPRKEDHWATLVRARAIENTIYVVAAGQTGPRCCGNSLVVDPMGVVLADGGEEPGYAVAEVRPERLERVRAKNPSLANRRFRVVADE
jgi:predicted amidohydrolase